MFSPAAAQGVKTAWKVAAVLQALKPGKHKVISRSIAYRRRRARLASPACHYSGPFEPLTPGGFRVPLPISTSRLHTDLKVGRWAVTGSPAIEDQAPTPWRGVLEPVQRRELAIRRKIGFRTGHRICDRTTCCWSIASVKTSACPT